jgi:predicted DNA-binding transcriptional regulator AlpA
MRKQQPIEQVPARLWSTKETAEFLGVPVSTLYLWSYQGTGGPKVYKVGRHLKYEPAEVMRWLETRAA